MKKTIKQLGSDINSHNMNDLVIHLGQSDINFLDLRYALRSVEKNVRNLRNVVIVGEKPSWIKNVVHIGCGDNPDQKWKERNIYNKIKVACISPDVSENFLSSNDDIFILKEIDATQYPYYYKGTVTESWLKNRSDYRKTMNHTRKYLIERGFDDKNFDTHTPIIYNKEKYLSSFNEVNWMTNWGYGVKSLYCAVNRIKGEYMPDLKIIKKHTKEEVAELVKNSHVVSCTDAPMKCGLAEYLEELFPKKSKYEQ